MPVYVFGFPFGRILTTGKGGPAITVGKGSVSSIRKNEQGKLAVVQIDGALNPGNSGGPVVDARGRLVGVAVATIRGANNIGLAIPPDELRELLGGRISGVGLYRKRPKSGATELQGEVWVLNERNAVTVSLPNTQTVAGAAPAAPDGVAHVQIEAVLLDPLGKVKTVHVYHRSSDKGGKLPAAEPDGTWPPLPESDKEELKISDRKAQATLTLPVARKGATYVFQLSYEGADGKMHFTQPRAFRVDAATEVVVRPPPKKDKEDPKKEDPVRPPTEPVARVPVPDKEALAAADKIVKDLFKEDYAKKAPADLLALSQTLHRQALETNDDAAARYVMLTEAADLAARAGDLVQALKVVEDLAARYEVSSGTAKAPVFEKANAVLKGKEESKLLAEEAQVAVGEALAADDFDAADRLIVVGQVAARKAQAAAMVSALAKRSDEAKKMREEFAKVQAALAALEKKPNDAAANEVAGKYYCLVKGDWGRGLPMLVQCNDTKLKELAEKDAATPGKTDEQIGLGDAWYDYGSAQEANVKTQAQLRAAYWYAQALPSLSGLTKTKVEARMAELDKLAEKHRTNGEALAAARDAVKDKRLQKTNMIGFGIGPEFEETLPEGGVLVGLELSLGKFFDNDVIESIRPIYLTPRGEKYGQQIGKGTDRVVTVKAKAGYAVGSLTVKGGLGIDGLSLTFMRINKGGLKKEDAYTSAWQGGKGGGDGVTVGGDGSLVVGICGRLSNRGKKKEDKACALGLVTVKAGK